MIYNTKNYPIDIKGLSADTLLHNLPDIQAILQLYEGCTNRKGGDVDEIYPDINIEIKSDSSNVLAHATFSLYGKKQRITKSISLIDSDIIEDMENTVVFLLKIEVLKYFPPVAWQLLNFKIKQ